MPPRQFREKFDDLFPAHAPAPFGQLVTAYAVLPAAGGGVQRKAHVLTGNHPRPAHRFFQQHQRVLIAGNVRGKAAFIPHGGGQALFLQKEFQGVIDLRAHAYRLLHAAGGNRGEHEFLNVHVVGRVYAAIEHVHHDPGQLSGGQPAQIPIQGQMQGGGRRPGAGHGNGENRVGPQAGEILRAVHLAEYFVQPTLIQGAFADQGLGDFSFHMGNRLQYAPAHEPVAAVPQLPGLVRAGGRAGGHAGHAPGPAAQLNRGFDGGISPGIVNLPGADFCYFRNKHLPFLRLLAKRGLLIQKKTGTIDL